MRHPSGAEVYFTADELRSASPDMKSTMLGMILNGYRLGEISAAETSMGIARRVTDFVALRDNRPVSKSDLSHGSLGAGISLDLLKDTHRLGGFINSIKRWGEQERVLDVGTGSFAILALAAAHYSPGAKVEAVEINTAAAESARRVIHAFGLSHRIEVINTDFKDYKVDPRTTAAVTETFNLALTGEPGPKIVKSLHEAGVGLITPSTAELRLRFGDHDFKQMVDMRTDTHAQIPLHLLDAPETTDPSTNWPEISAAYYDDLGLVLDYDHDNFMTAPYEAWDISKRLCHVLAEKRRAVLRYELGAPHTKPLPRIDIEFVEDKQPTDVVSLG